MDGFESKTDVKVILATNKIGKYIYKYILLQSLIIIIIYKIYNI